MIRRRGTEGRQGRQKGLGPRSRSCRFYVFCFCLFCLACLSCAPGKGLTAYVGATLWDGTGEHPTPFSDLNYTVSVSSGDLQRTLLVSEYFPPTRTDQTAIMPAPLDEVYTRLSGIAAGAVEVRTEKISQ